MNMRLSNERSWSTYFEAAQEMAAMNAMARRRKSFCMNLFVTCFLYRIPREFFHLHDCLHEFRLSLGCTTSHILCEILWDEVPWDAISISDPSAHLRFRLCGEVLVIIIQIFLTLTRDHPWCSTGVLEVGSTIQRCEFIRPEEGELDDHDVSLFRTWKVVIWLFVDSLRGDTWVRKYRAVVFCHFESIVVVRPEASGEHKEED